MGHLCTLGITIHAVELQDTLTVVQQAMVHPADVVTALCIPPNAQERLKLDLQLQQLLTGCCCRWQ